MSYESTTISSSTPQTNGSGNGAPVVETFGGDGIDETSRDFAILFRGGKVAIDDDDHGGFRPWRADDGTFLPADDKEFVVLVDDHLHRGPSIGVYPLFHVDGDFLVYWGCVDWDEGHEEALVHARNVQAALHQLGVASWVERSRSKGFHLWVFFDKAVSAVDVRRGLIGVCSLVDAPTIEVNPKQVKLSGRGWGNGVRLPYGHLRNPGGYNEVVNPDAVYSQVSVHSFVQEAVETRTTTDEWKAVSALWRPPEPLPAPPTGSTPYTGPLRGSAATVRERGPIPTPEKPKGDRSRALWALACIMARQGHTQEDTLKELRAADIEWGGKYSNREDGDQRLQDTVHRAYKIALT